MTPCYRFASMRNPRVDNQKIQKAMIFIIIFSSVHNFKEMANKVNESTAPSTSKASKALRYTGYVATFGISYLIRRNNKRNKQQKAPMDDKPFDLPTSIENVDHRSIEPNPTHQVVTEDFPTVNFSTKASSSVHSEPVDDTTQTPSHDYSPSSCDEVLSLSSSPTIASSDVDSNEVPSHRICYCDAEISERDNILSNQRLEIAMLKDNINTLIAAHATEIEKCKGIANNQRLTITNLNKKIANMISYERHEEEMND